jgi:predicted small lipoprotein YifL
LLATQDAKEFEAMPDPLKLILAAGLLSLGACGGKGDDKAAEEVEQAFENKAEALDRAAENASGAAEEKLEDQAEIYRRTGEAAAEAVDDVDLDAEAAGNAQ